MEQKVKKGLFLVLFLVLLLPWAQYVIPIVKSVPLYGYYTGAQDLELTAENWFSGAFAEQKNKVYNEHVGFRTDMVRLHSELQYKLFGELQSIHVVEGRRNVLYQKAYIDAYYGKDFVGNDTVVKKMTMLKAIQDTFASLGKSLIFVQTPCKAFFYPDDFPIDRVSVKTGANNYEVYKHVADSLGVNQIDFNSWFITLKPQSKELLYAKQGIHWSWYGALLASDCLATYMEQRLHLKMIHPIWTEVDHTTDARFTDDDIAAALNLISPLTTETFCYPKYTFSPPDSTRPKVILIGDSFINTIVDNYFIREGCSDWEFWYYMQELRNEETEKQGYSQSLKGHDLFTALDHTDCVLLMYSSHNLSRLGDGFIEKVYAHYYPNSALYINE